MSERYIARVVKVSGKYTVVINAGSEHGVVIGAKFLLVGLGEVIVDPDTNEELERLEVVRGTAKAIHVQSRISTLESVVYDKTPDEKEITKVTARGGIALLGGPQDTVTEKIKPGEQVLRELRDVQVGDFAVAV